MINTLFMMVTSHVMTLKIKWQEEMNKTCSGIIIKETMIKWIIALTVSLDVHHTHISQCLYVSVTTSITFQ